ncbi:MAG: glycoside hydrolase family 15 protein, partial [Candidatus Omnitrophota bacterium]|nr:glycoside hydrolase family 15 protein [Candidatus Omnitrophota bacterium]
MKNYDYGIIGNCTSAALIGPDCSIDWLCLPFFDSSSLFARLLDDEKGGHFRISAEDVLEVSQEYISYTPILKTTFKTGHGVFEVRDYMPRFVTGRDEYFCPSEVQRDIHVVSGSPRIIIDLKPMPNYALGGANPVIYKDYVKLTSQGGEYNSFYLYTDLDKPRVIDGRPIELKAGVSYYLLLSYHEKLEPVNIERVYVEYEKTKSYWLGWAHKTKVPETYKDWVIRAAVTLKLLMFQRTGAVIAAPTTSLPEIIGKERNWDYRYCWIRDASMIIDLYARIGHARSSSRYIQFILNRMLLKHDNISAVYGINGEKELVERTLDHLKGYESSRPVRVGNDAYRQRQNDLYGELIETIYSYFVLLRHRGEIYFDEELWTVVRALVNDVLETWQEPDSGIWEKRGEAKHHVHSKLMNWVAMDRAARIAKHVGKTDYAERCLKMAAKIKQDILAHGWNPKVKAFTMSYGSDDLDAANLLMLHYGFLDRTDPMIVSTVEQTCKHLVRNNLVLRYTAEDDFGLPENAFVVCTFWLINALCLTGQEQKAREMFENLLKFANPHKLFSEDIEIATGRLTGNFPQGYSHLALIQTVFLLETDYNWSDVFRG